MERNDKPENEDNVQWHIQPHSLKIINLLLSNELFVQALLDWFLGTQDNLITSLSANHFLADVMHE